tara:strand:+ start:491 stop:955 length:465 start_codon:yes stop_codon:yes gene_type:complete
MNSFYKRPKPETMKKNREINKEKFHREIDWLKQNLELIKDNKFLVDMYTILISGSRKMTPKMIGAVQKAMDNPMYDKVKRIERMDKIKPIMEKINMVYNIVKSQDENKSEYFKRNYSSLRFIESVKGQLKNNGKLSEKQMQALNKIYKRYTEKK